MQFNAKVSKGGFNEKKSWVTLEIGDPHIIGELNMLVDQLIQVTIDDLMPIDCVLSKGAFDANKTTFTLNMKPAIDKLDSFARMAENGSQVEVELSNPEQELAFAEPDEPVKPNAKRAKERPMTEKMLTQPEPLEGVIPNEPNIELTIDEDGWERWGGKLYKELNAKERKAVDEFVKERGL